MHRTHRARRREHRDQSFDLSPATEMHDIADIAAPVGASRGLVGGRIAVAGDQVGGGIERGGIGYIRNRRHRHSVHAFSPRYKLHANPPEDECPPAPVVNTSGTKSPSSRHGTLASPRGTWQGTAMANDRPPAAGGALIALGAIVGAAIGFLVGEATPGMLIGTAAGIAIALLIWWRGRR